MEMHCKLSLCTIIITCPFVPYVQSTCEISTTTTVKLPPNPPPTHCRQK